MKEQSRVQVTSPRFSRDEISRVVKELGN